MMRSPQSDDHSEVSIPAFSEQRSVEVSACSDSRRAIQIFSRRPGRQSQVVLTIAVFLTCCNLGVTLRFFAERYFLTQPPLSMNWTPAYCFIAGMLLTPFTIRLLNSIEELEVWSRRVLVTLNVLSLFSLISPLVYYFFRDSLM